MSLPEPTPIASAAITTPDGHYIPFAFRTDPDDPALGDLKRFVQTLDAAPTMNQRIRQAVKRGVR
ncbi:MAG: hypothetical protein WCJ55_18960 [Chloroflexales bacterium]